MDFALRVKNVTPLPTPVIGAQLIVSPLTSAVMGGQTGGPFTPSSFVYSLSTQFGSISYSVGCPVWLTPSSSGGSVTTTPTAITFTPNTSTNALVAGVYTDSISFTNNSFSQTPIVIPITLTVIQLPAGALGIWYADQAITTGGNPVIPNLLSAVAVPKNLMRAPRRVFSVAVGGFWRSISVVVVDNNVVGPDGLTQASTATCTGPFALQYEDPILGGAGITWPAGTYTLGVNVKRATGSDQTFKIKAPDGTSSAAKTATSAWQRFTYTWTAGAPVTGSIAIVDNAGANAVLAVCDFEMFQGSSDLGPELLAGHMYLGGSAVSNLPTTSGGYVDFTANSGSTLAFLQFLTPQTLTSFTISALVNRTATGASLRSILEELNHFLDFVFYTSTVAAGEKFIFNFAATDPLIDAQAGLWNHAVGIGAHAITVRYDATTVDLFFDDVRCRTSSANPALSQAIANLFVGFLDGGTGANSGDKLAALAIWPSALSNAQLYNVLDIWKVHFSSLFTYTMHPYYYFADGDSITSGISNGYPAKYGPTASQSVFGQNIAIGGVGIATIAATNLPIWTASIPPASRRTNRHFVLSVLIGTNDLSTVTGPTEAAAVASSFVDPLQAAGFSVIIGTVIDRNAGIVNPAWTNNALSFNNIVRTSWGHGTAIIDFAANVHFGPPGSGAAADGTYYSDGTHLTVTGENLMVTILKPVADAAGP